MTNLFSWHLPLLFLASVGFVLLFLLIELALAWVLVAFKLAAHRSSQPGWVGAYRFWVRVFALSGVLVLAGSVPLLLQLGSAWPGLIERTGNVLGPLVLWIMVVSLVFRSCFLGGMLFGQQKLPRVMHTLMVILAAVGVSLTAWLACVMLGWLMHPVGGAWEEGRFVVEAWSAVMRNRVAWELFGLLLGGSALTVACMMLGVLAQHSLQHPVQDADRIALRTGLVLALGGCVLLGALVTTQGAQAVSRQPARAAATMGYWHSDAPPQWVVFAWPSAHHQKNLWAVQGAGGQAWLSHDEHGQPMGLERFAGMTPPVAAVFWSARLFVGLLMAITALTLISGIQLVRHQFMLEHLSPGWRRCWARVTYLGWWLAGVGAVYVFAGQWPYAVYGTLTLNEVGEAHGTAAVLFGWGVQGLVYTLLMVGFIGLLRYTVRHGVVPVARYRGRA